MFPSEVLFVYTVSRHLSGRPLVDRDGHIYLQPLCMPWPALSGSCSFPVELVHCDFGMFVGNGQPLVHVFLWFANHRRSPGEVSVKPCGNVVWPLTWESDVLVSC